MCRLQMNQSEWEMKTVEKLCVRMTRMHDTNDMFKFFLFLAVQEYSVLLVSFHLQRHMGNFLIQVYGPCICKKNLSATFFCSFLILLFQVLVVLSWVSFWLNREATADR